LWSADLWNADRVIGAYSNGSPMTLTEYGTGANSGAEYAVFFIARIHSDESGAGVAVRLIESYIQTLTLPAGTRVYVLNPASVSGTRLVNGIDPNRDFLDKKLPETRAIAAFSETLAQQYKRVLIVSAHQYNDKNRGTIGQGFVFPMYRLTPTGERKIAGKAGSAIISMKEQSDYLTPSGSEAAAQRFVSATGFTYESLWKNEMYPGEYMYFLSKLGAHVSMIEFEVPESERGNITRWQAGFARFALAVCILPMNEQA
jgi:hypothetical protein